MILFGSDKCGQCPPAKKYLENKGIDFRWVNITESMQNLREFLALRDQREEFTEIKREGYVGIPCLLTDEGKIVFDVEDYF